MENKKMNLQQFTALVRELNWLTCSDRWGFFEAYEEVDSEDYFDAIISQTITRGSYLYAYLAKCEYDRMRVVRNFAAYEWECDEKMVGYNYIVLWRIN